MVAFLAALSPPPNARAWRRLHDDGGVLEGEEARGWQAFQRRCLSCHAARVFADDPASQLDVANDDVVSALLRGALVFGRDGYEDTGVRPKVHPLGARPSSLRGVSGKAPLLTNGHAKDLAAVLSLARVDGARFLHESTTGTPLPPSEQRALLALLRLL
jgi:hypothetical protein